MSRTLKVVQKFFKYLCIKRTSNEENVSANAIKTRFSDVGTTLEQQTQVISKCTVEIICTAIKTLFFMMFSDVKFIVNCTRNHAITSTNLI